MVEEGHLLALFVFESIYVYLVQWHIPGT
jgi:hypothetical protein